MCQLEAGIAREIGDIVKGALTPFGVRIAALDARVNGLENANAFAVGTSFRDIRPLLESLRPFKDAGELELVRKATNASVPPTAVLILRKSSWRGGSTAAERAARFAAVGACLYASTAWLIIDLLGPNLRLNI